MRPDGSRTRLVPVDKLPYPLAGIPVTETGPDAERLIALPIPTGVGRDGRNTNTEPLRPVSNYSCYPSLIIFLVILGNLLERFPLFRCQCVALGDVVL